MLYIIVEYPLEPFVVGFKETMYTAFESEGSVEVCVELTRPPFDILDETVHVRVTDYPHSVYIPSAATLASEMIFLASIILLILYYCFCIQQLQILQIALVGIAWFQEVTMHNRPNFSMSLMIL